jgi:hypothetical protein
LGKSVSVLYGNLPPEVKKRQIEEFISGRTQLLVTTDVILYNYYFGSSSHLTSNKKYRGQVQKTLNEIITKTKENNDNNVQKISPKCGNNKSIVKNIMVD